MAVQTESSVMNDILAVRAEIKKLNLRILDVEVLLDLLVKNQSLDPKFFVNQAVRAGVTCGGALRASGNAAVLKRTVTIQDLINDAIVVKESLERRRDAFAGQLIALETVSKKAA